eukprot:m51a1_g7753 putative adenylate guanylate cyclase (809) ;mRNA; f:57095-61312
MENHSSGGRRCTEHGCAGAAGDMRSRVVAALVGVVAVAAAAMAASFVRVSATQLQAIEGAQASSEAAMLRGMLVSQQAALRSLLVPLAHIDDVYNYLAAQDPMGHFWIMVSQYWALLETNDLEAALFVLPNGTMLNGLMWGPDRASKIRASESLARQVGAQLVRTGSASGIFWVAETCVSQAVLSAILTLHRMTRNTAVVVQTELTSTSECHAIKGIWKGTPVQVGQQFYEDTVNHMVAKASELACAQVTCSSASNQTHDTYLATGVVLSDGEGVARVYAVIRGIRFDAETIGTYMRYIIAICCSALAAIFLLVYLLVELSVLRRTEDRIKIRGKSEIRNVTRAVNELLSALERRTMQTEFIMQNIYPEEVLRRLRSGQSTSQTFQDTSVLFVDICNFTLWFTGDRAQGRTHALIRSSALDPKIVTRYLNGLYSRMDDIVHMNRATKVMTIGDAYVVASGVAQGQIDYTHDISEIAFAFSSSAIIGLKKKFYELWGPSVTLSQQIQEMANPGSILCCGATKDALEARNKGHYLFDSFVDADGKMHAWKLSSVDNDRDLLETQSERSLSSAGLLSVMADDMSVIYSPDDGESLSRRVLRSLRFGSVLGITALLAASIVAFTVFLLTMLDASSRESIRHRAVADGTRISKVLSEVLTIMRLEGGLFSAWTAPVDYVSAGIPDGQFWKMWIADGSVFNQQGLDGIVYVLPNGTIFNSLGYDYATASLRNISTEEKTVLALQEGIMPNERHAMASILFSDIIGFRDWATVASPDAVSQFLSSFTEGLDAIVEQCCATKIKTILDIYSIRSIT